VARLELTLMTRRLLERLPVFGWLPGTRCRCERRTSSVGSRRCPWSSLPASQYG